MELLTPSPISHTGQVHLADFPARLLGSLTRDILPLVFIYLLSKYFLLPPVSYSETFK
jgi:hypothetical protein